MVNVVFEGPLATSKLLQVMNVYMGFEITWNNHKIAIVNYIGFIHKKNLLYEKKIQTII